MSDDLRDTLIESAAAGEEFLKRQIRRLSGISNIDDHDRVVSRWRFSFTATIPNEVPPDGKKSEAYVNAGYARDSSDFVLYNFRTFGKFRKKKIGTAMLKAVMGVVYGADVPALVIAEVTGDGRTFWPAHGALPIDEPVTLVSEIDKALAENMAAIPKGSDAFIEILRIRNVAKQNPYRGFRELAQCDIALSNGEGETFPLFRNIVFNRMCRQMRMVIIPSELGTQKMLSDRLGRIPVFPPLPPDQLHYKEICAKLAPDGCGARIEAKTAPRAG